jgi:hypothetical protein
MRSLFKLLMSSHRSCDRAKTHVQAGTFAILLSLLFCGFMMNQESVPAVAKPLHWLSYFAQSYELLVVGEFEHNPAQFTFTAPVKSLPPLRVSGAGVLAQFGYQPGRVTQNFLALALFAAVCAAGTYVSLLLGHPDVANALSTLFMTRSPRHGAQPCNGCLRSLLGLVFGDSGMRLLDPGSFLEESIAGTPGTAPSSLAVPRCTSDSGDLDKVLCLSSPQRSPTAEQSVPKGATNTAPMPNPASDSVSEAPKKAGLREASAVELIHCETPSRHASGSGLATSTDEAAEPEKRHARSVSSPESWGDSGSTVHTRQLSNASEASTSGRVGHRTGHLRSISTASAAPFKNDKARVSEHRASSAAVSSVGKGRDLQDFKSDCGDVDAQGAELADHDIAIVHNAGNVLQNLHEGEQYHHVRRTLSWHGLNVSVKLWNGVLFAWLAFLASINPNLGCAMLSAPGCF